VKQAHDPLCGTLMLNLKNLEPLHHSYLSSFKGHSTKFSNTWHLFLSYSDQQFVMINICLCQLSRIKWKIKDDATTPISSILLTVKVIYSQCGSEFWNYISKSHMWIS